MNPSSPATLGKYQVIREIARSNDIVYEGYDPVMNRRVALKELAMPHGATSTQTQERIKRFQREVRAAGSLGHPGIVTIFEFGEDNGRHFMAMEYLDGRTLRQELDAKGFLPTERALEIIIEVLSALEAAHKSGVIHRDIKPENIQILSDGRIKLTDFGIARLTFEPNITLDGQVFGTPSYMSPEQVVGRDLDARSDLFSVGAVLFEILTGNKAFPGDSVVSISYAIANKEPDYPTSWGSDLLALCRNALQKVPDLRFNSAEQMRQAAEQVQKNLHLPPVTATPMHTQLGVPPSVWQTAQHPQPPTVMPPPYSGAPGQYPQQGQYVPIPIYLPPPKLPPLFKPETKALFGRIFAMILSILLLMGIAYVATQAVGKAAVQVQRQDEPKAGGNPATTQENVNEAAQFESIGKQALAAGDLQRARQNFEEAVKSAPSSATHHTNLGDVLAKLAETETEPETRVDLWRASAQEWRLAAQYEPDSARQRRFQDGAAVALYNAAVRAEDAGNRAEARRLLSEARSLALPNSETEAEILKLWEALGG